MTKRASTLEFRKELETTRGPSRLSSRARRLGRLLRRSERGTAVVEFALVVVPLTLIVFGILDFGRALNYYNDLTQLAGQGARAAAVNQNPDGTVADGNFQKILAGEADSPELKNAGNHLNACITAVPSGNGQPVTVTVNYSFHFIPLVHPIAITLSATQTERFEGITPSYTATPPCSGP
jgi:Flp pilus assembly protein TadG